MYLIEMFGVSLLLTLVIELVVAIGFRIPAGKNWLPIVLVNLLTNPAVVFLNWVIGIYEPQLRGIGLQIPLEILVVLVEFGIYKSFSRAGWKCKSPLCLALVSNGISWLLGVLFS